MLAEVSGAMGENMARISHLSAVVAVHPFAPSIWLKLAEAYEGLGEAEAEPLPISGGEFRLKSRARAFCLVRSHVLLRTVEKTVRAFAKTANEKRKSAIKSTLEEMKLSSEEVDRMELFASMDVFNRKDEDEDKGEFEDLGRSARQRAIEESYREGEGEKNMEDHVNSYCLRETVAHVLNRIVKCDIVIRVTNNNTKKGESMHQNYIALLMTRNMIFIKLF